MVSANWVSKKMDGKSTEAQYMHLTCSNRALTVLLSAQTTVLVCLFLQETVAYTVYDIS